MLIDPYGRAITYLRVSITDRCNLRCGYCMPPDGLKWLPPENLLSAGELLRVVEAAVSLGIKKVRLTGGEPLVRPDVLSIVQGIAALQGVEDLSLTTNGMLLKPLAKSLADAGLQRVNISLDTLDPQKFHKMTRFGDFSRVWEGILAAEEAGLAPIKINSVVVGGFNERELPDLARLSVQHAWHIRFIELMPVANQQDWGDGLPSNGRYVSFQRMESLLDDLHLQPVDTSTHSGPERIFRIPGAPGTVGFISPLGDQFCSRCNRLRLTADGGLRSCLLVDREISIREALQTGADLREFLVKAVENKPEGHELAKNHSPQSRTMSQIGG